MRPAQGSSAASSYPERPERVEGFADRLFTGLGYYLHNAFSRGPRDFSLLQEATRECRARFRSGLLAPRVPELRYQLRKHGLRSKLVPEVLALSAAAIESAGDLTLSPQALGAAELMILGRIVDVPDPLMRRQAAACAATAFALAGIRVHVIASSDVQARRSAALLAAPAAALGFSVGCIAQGVEPHARREAYDAEIVCGGHREIAYDYLRDRLLLGGRPQRLRNAVERLAGDAPPEGQLLLKGLQCAIVEDADLTLIDDARAPLVISTESDQSQARLLYEQAIELARALAESVDFYIDDRGVALTGSGSGRLARLTKPLGGVWGGQHRREQLLLEALHALHLLERDRDYQVVNGQLMFPDPEPDEVEKDPGSEDMRRKLLEVKEGLKLSGRRDLLARISVPRFFQRYLHVCGTCADARGLEPELWSMYGLKAECVGMLAASVACPIRLFETHAHKHAAVLARIAELQGKQCGVVISVRTPETAKAIVEGCQEAGVRAEFVRGTGDEQEAQILAAAHLLGAVTVSVYPAERNIAIAEGTTTHLIVADMQDAGRHVIQQQRAYRAQCCELLVSMEEESVSAQLDLGSLSLAALSARHSGEVSPLVAGPVVRLVQRRLERANRILRAEVKSLDQFLGNLLAFAGTRD